MTIPHLFWLPVLECCPMLPKITSLRISTKSGCMVMRRPDDSAKPSGAVAHFAKLRISTQILQATASFTWMKSIHRDSRNSQKDRKRFRKHFSWISLFYLFWVFSTKWCFRFDIAVFFCQIAWHENETADTSVSLSIWISYDSKDFQFCQSSWFRSLQMSRCWHEHGCQASQSGTPRWDDHFLSWHLSGWPRWSIFNHSKTHGESISNG